tara:strand:- start:232 stop:1335 length:1104 start_codon:yes stop_codon:yes gene_type:complete
MSNPGGLWYPKEQPIQGMTGMWGGVSSALIGGGGGSVGSINAIPNGVAGQLLFSGYGFESWINPTTDFSWTAAPNNANSTNRLSQGQMSGNFNFVVPDSVEKIRVILIGGGGASSDAHNVLAAEGAGGIESFVEVTAGETLNFKVGKGGGGGDGSPGDGGDTQMFRPSHSTTQPILRAYGACGTEWTHNRQSGTERVSGDWGNVISSPLRISMCEGGSAAGQGDNPASSAQGHTMPLNGASYHGGGAGNGTGTYGNGLGFGGGGGRWQTGNNFSEGGTWGFSGNAGGGSGSKKGPNPGPVPGFSNPEGKWTNASPYGGTEGGGGGGSYGGGGSDGWTGGFGAGGLVRVWWADSDGDATWINTAGNYQ